jgi:hypothetical protein
MGLPGLLKLASVSLNKSGALATELSRRDSRGSAFPPFAPMLARLATQAKVEQSGKVRDSRVTQVPAHWLTRNGFRTCSISVTTYLTLADRFYSWHASAVLADGANCDGTSGPAWW